jgi:hypothetical protein
LDSETSAAGAASKDLSVLTQYLMTSLFSASSSAVVVAYLQLLGSLRQKGEAQTPLMSVSHTSLAESNIRLLG